MRDIGIRRVAGLAATVIVALAVLLSGAAPAQAHAVLLFASPAVEGATAKAPEAVSLVFDEPVQPTGPEAVRVSAPGGRQVELGPAARSEGGKQLTLPVRGAMGAGVYTVAWEAVADDGDVMSGSYRFAIGSAAAALSAGSGSEQRVSGASETAVARWILYASFALALGGLAGERLARRRRAADGPPAPRSWALPAALAGIVAALILAVIIAGGGSLARGVSSPSTEALFGSRPGLLALAQVAGWLAAAVALRAGRRQVACAVLLAAAVAEGLRAHPAGESAVWGPVLTSVHLVAAAVWIGALVYVLRVGTAWEWKKQARALLGDYARVAAGLLATVLLTGTLSGLLMVSPTQLLDTDFGRLLAVKLTLVGTVCTLALLARIRLRRSAPRVLVRVEASALAAVLAATALLTVTQPPSAGDAALPFAPPPNGDAITVGGRADEIGIAATASAGQVTLRLTAPDTDRERPGKEEVDYDAALTVTLPDGRSRPLTAQSCGEGCFHAPVTWRKGLNLLTVRAGAEGWGGGADTLRVMWPVHPDAGQLKRTVAAMRAAEQITLHELVASDSRGATVDPTRLELSGDRFVDSEPYAKGRAPLSSSFTDAEGQTVLALGFPGERLALELTLDEEDRVSRETLIAPNHKISRTFTYPEPKRADDGHDHEHDAG